MKRALLSVAVLVSGFLGYHSLHHPQNPVGTIVLPLQDHIFSGAQGVYDLPAVTIPTTGEYEVSASVPVAFYTGRAMAFVQLQVNGNTEAQSAISMAGIAPSPTDMANEDTANFTRILSLAAGDVLHIEYSFATNVIYDPGQTATLEIDGGTLGYAVVVPLAAP